MRIRDWSSDVCSSDLEASMRPGAQEPYHATFGGANRQANIAMLASREEDIAALQHEMLVLHGRFDQVIPLESSVRLATLLPRADLNVFGECGHWVPIERMARFTRVGADDRTVVVEGKGVAVRVDPGCGLTLK